MRTQLLLLVGTFCLVGCNAGTQRPRAFVEVPAKAIKPRHVTDAASSDHPVLAISQDIRDACGISDSRAFFAYNSAQLVSRDRSLLEQLASCFTTGPLKGRAMRLVGHADPRGDDEYNYLLGQRRADRAKDAIIAAGLPGTHVSTTSRGENEATGQDETGWSKDRRVEVILGDTI